MGSLMSTMAGRRAADWKWIGTAAMGALLSILLPPTVRAEPNTVKCSLQKTGEIFSGSCSIPCSVNNLAIDIDGVNPRRACDRPERVVPASLKPMPGEQWLGAMQGKEPEDPTRFELAKGKKGAPDVAKLPYGWFRLAESKREGDSLSLIILANRTLAPTSDDIRIIQRTLQLLSGVQVWNKADDRKCPQNPGKWSLYCALTQATTEISGGVHYRQPALQAVREVLNEVDGRRARLHRLMEYNNDPDTSLEDVHNMLKLTQQRLEKRVMATASSGS